MNKTIQCEPQFHRLSGIKLTLIAAYFYTLYAFDLPIMACMTLTAIVFAFVVVVYMSVIDDAHRLIVWYQEAIAESYREREEAIVKQRNEIQKQLDKEAA